MGRIPHPIAARRGRRAPGGVAGNKRLARRGRGRRCRRSCGLRRRRLLSYGCRVYAADLINSIMKRFRPAEPDEHGDKKKLAEQAHERTSLSDQGWQIQGANTILNCATEQRAKSQAYSPPVVAPYRLQENYARKRARDTRATTGTEQSRGQRPRLQRPISVFSLFSVSAFQPNLSSVQGSAVLL